MGSSQHPLLPASKAKKGKRYRLKRETQPDQVWRTAGKNVLVIDLAMTLVVTWNEATEEVKYFFRVAKQDVGLVDYEGRKYQGLLWHLILCLLVLGFVSIQTHRLREEKSRDHVGASKPSVESAVR